jgi:hypothetical protein
MVFLDIQFWILGGTMINTDKPVISSPEGAKLQAVEELYDAANPNGAIIISVHEVDQHLVGNVWLRERETYTRLITERTVKHEEQTENSALLFLKGEWFRYALENKGQENDMPFKLSILGLEQTINSLMEKLEDRVFKKLLSTDPESVNEVDKITTLGKLLERKDISYLYINPASLQYLMTCGIPNNGEAPIYAEACGQHDIEECPQGWLTANTSRVMRMKEIFIYFPGRDLPIAFEIVDQLRNYKIEKIVPSSSTTFAC